MTSALIGHGGFVASNLEVQARFDEQVEARAAERLRGRAFDLLVCAAPAGRRRARSDPEADRAAMQRLMEALGAISAARVLLLSTVEVFPHPERVDEDAPIEPSAPYARHRRELELFCREKLSATVVRLPLAFGPGLSTGVVFDLLAGGHPERIHPDALLQHYPIAHLWRDASLALERRIPELNLACEPITTRELALRCFGQELTAYPVSAPGVCDVRSKYAPLWGGQPSGYLYPKASVLLELAGFVEREREL
jgi:nucleoside-diphosphate-sugar epimerase